MEPYLGSFLPNEVINHWILKWYFPIPMRRSIVGPINGILFAQKGDRIRWILEVVSLQSIGEIMTTNTLRQRLEISRMIKVINIKGAPKDAVVQHNYKGP